MSNHIRALNTYPKRPNEICWLEVEMSNQLSSGESLSGSPTATPPDDSNLTCDNVSISGTNVVFRVTGGTVQAAAYCVVVQVGATGGAGARTIERVCPVLVTTGCCDD